ncbi:hypothetical protein [Sediminibacterium sp.]|jgi:hypothetical protein|uniref:hypothetical protein n=1 Tax=Sediminibacterium sp. TaxID=1917865 RepID=UPI002600FD1C|nr:hypothetical protein [Sediminibacterium sp.]MBW0178686.1 carboxypeptidase-like regulatory domain-containing protein [Sediminibacterium sp.]
MRNILFVLFFAILTFSACSSAKKTQKGEIEQGISGLITEIKGNQMPKVGVAPATPKPVSTTLYVYEPTHISQVKPLETGSPLYTTINRKLVASVLSDSLGRYSVALPAGTYSVFVKKGDYFFANMFDRENNIQLVSVDSGKITPLNILINSGASY